MEIERENEKEGREKEKTSLEILFAGSRWVSTTTAYMLAPAGFRRGF